MTLTISVRKLRRSLAAAALCSAAALVGAAMPDAAYLDGKESKSAVILAHGQGADPSSEVVDPLRKSIHKELGFHTLSLQMPVIAGRRSPELFQEYASTFADAEQRIQTAIDFLRREKGVERV